MIYNILPQKLLNKLQIFKPKYSGTKRHSKLVPNKQKQKLKTKQSAEKKAFQVSAQPTAPFKNIAQFP